MASFRLNENRDSYDASPENLFPSELNDSGEPDAEDEFFGLPEIPPRIGSEFQVEVPLLEWGTQSGEVKDAEASRKHNFLIGLPIQLTWISLKLDLQTKNEGKEFNDKFGIRIEQPNDSRMYLGDSGNIPKEKRCNDGSRFLVPGLSTELWNDDEKASFLLGLYIFEKNFVELRRFVETKGMGAILSFYYGEFYGSNEYQRWADCKKTKSKKCVHGQRIFSGWRQQELLSRILPKVSEDCRTAVSKVSKTFLDDKMSLMDYVSSLKAMVGMKILVDAIGIGTGKKDLTGRALEHSRSKQGTNLRPEIPSGKACSSLTTAEIINFLNGGYRLSKARSNDLFWEAVWPRLLARGWHSEQPNDQGYLAGFKNTLVFLVPGVKKFSRRKLVKGDQYFDSVTDILNKVAKEPGLIELGSEQEAGEEMNKECDLIDENVEDDEEDADNDDRHTKQRHCYLQPRTPNRCGDLIKFMVVDTSLSNGQVRELRSLPSEISSMTTSKLSTEAADNRASVEATDDSETINTILRNASMMVSGSTKTGKSGDRMLLGGIPKAYASYEDTSKVHPSGKTQLQEKKQSNKVSKSLFGPNLKQGNGDHMGPISKKCRRLAACSNEAASDDVSHSWMETKPENAMTNCSSGVHGFTGNLSSAAGSCQDKVSSTNSSRGSPCESIDCATYKSTHASEANHQRQTLIDLNIPQISPEFENGMFAAELRTEHVNQREKPDGNCLPDVSGIEARPEQRSTDQILLMSSVKDQRSEQPSDVIPRRQGTRNRPPTARALEAVASGYLTVGRKRKNKEATRRGDIEPKVFQRPRIDPGPIESTSVFVGPQVKEADNFMAKGGTGNVSDKFYDLPQGIGESVSRQ